MPDRRSHRGAHPEDERLFAQEKVPDLQAAMADYCLLLTKGYAQRSSLKLVGDKFALTQRQRLALMRSGCSDQQLALRQKKCLSVIELADQEIAIDGYNLLITVEAALAGGVIFEGHDRCYRDLASIHGTYRKVSETMPAVRLIGEFIEEAHTAKVQWLLDKPVSNSGHLKKLISELAREHGWDWEVELVMSPDAVLVRSEAIVVSSDSVILDGCKVWTNLARWIIAERVKECWLVDLVGSD